jgi:hypothetical protein
MKQTHFGGFNRELYTSYHHGPPNLPSNTRDSNFGLGNPLFKKFQVQTSHKANFAGPPSDFKPAQIDPHIKGRLSHAHWDIGTPSTGPILNTITTLSYQQRDNSLSKQIKTESTFNKQVMRGHHYTMGDNQLNYETTSNRKERHHPSAESPAKNIVPSVQEQKTELAKHHFDFGHEDGGKVSTH